MAKLSGTHSMFISLVFTGILISGCGGGVPISDLEQAVTIKESLITEIATASNEVENLKDDIDTLNRDIRNKESVIEDIEKSLDLLSSEKIQLEADIAAKNVTLSDINASNEELESQRAIAISSMQEAEDEVVNWKQNSWEYKNYINFQQRIINENACAGSIISTLKGVGLQDSSAETKIKNQVSGFQVLTQADINKAKEIIEVSSEGRCPFWTGMDDDPTFISNKELFRLICVNEGFAVLNRNPTKYDGQCVRGWGNVSQFDSNTGPCRFHAYIDETKQWRTYNYDYRVEFKASSVSGCSWLDTLEEGMSFAFLAIGDGRLDYTTTNGGQNSIPSMRIFMIAGSDMW